MFRKILLELLSGNWQCWSNLPAPPAARFVVVGSYLRLYSAVSVSCCHRAVSLVVKERLPPPLHLEFCEL